MYICLGFLSLELVYKFFLILLQYTQLTEYIFILLTAGISCSHSHVMEIIQLLSINDAENSMNYEFFSRFLVNSPLVLIAT